MSDGIGWDFIRSGSFGSGIVQTRVSKPSVESSPPFVSESVVIATGGPGELYRDSV